jgi:NADH:ubiquinone oxidoreductase subunit E
MDLTTVEQQEELIIEPDGMPGQPEDLLPLLQHYQKKYGYISEESVRRISLALRISENQIYGVASFYSQFRFQKPGEISVRVCLGTACHVQGGDKLSKEIQKNLGVRPGETTPDHRYEFHEVACLGCCAQASVLEINGRIYGKMTPDQIGKVLKEHDEL